MVAGMHWGCTVEGYCTAVDCTVEHCTVVERCTVVAVADRTVAVAAVVVLRTLMLPDCTEAVRFRTGVG